MKIRTPDSSSLVLSTLSLVALAACGGGGSGGGTVGAISGSMSVLQADETSLEAEPNDSATSSHRLGNIAPGETRTVLGSITDDGSDPFDGFQIVAPVRSTINVVLTAANAGADLDLFLVDPVSLQFIDGLTSPNASESGSFTVKGAAYIVVQSASGASDYDMAISAVVAPSPIPEEEPNNGNLESQYLGEMSGGDSFQISGSTSGGDNELFLIAMPEAGTLDLNLTFPTGQDFDLNVNDATSDLSSPSLLQSFTSVVDGSEQGSLVISAMTLVQVEVVAASGSGAWNLTLTRSAPLLAAGHYAPLNPAPRASLAQEGVGQLKRTGSAAFTKAPPECLEGEVVIASEGGLLQVANVASRGGRIDQVGGQSLHQLKFDLPPNLTAEEKARYTQALVGSMASVDRAAYAEPNFLYQPLFETRPNDSLYNLQWHYEALNLPAAWDLQTGAAGVTVAILDTGSTPHPDLNNREVPGIDLISNVSIAGDGDGIDSDPFDVGDSNGPQPSSYHGSHVAGTVGAETNNGQGVSGVTWAGGMLHVRLLGIGGGSNFDITQGVLYAGGQANSSGTQLAQPVDVMNMSLGGPGFSQSMQNAVTAARNAGTVIIAAAGNENSSTPSYPAAYDGVLSVAAVGFDLSRAPYSNFHPTVDLAAPGGNVSVDLNGDGYADGVLSTKPDDQVNPVNFDSYSFYQGTSMAAPHVAGVAALMLSENPALTVSDVESILTSTATDLGAAGKDNQFGFGLVNAFAAVQQAGGGGSGAPMLSLGESTVLLSAPGSGGATCRNVAVSNTGGMTLMVTAANATTVTGGNWLTATPIAALSGTQTDTSSIEVCANPAGLADGTYRGSVDVQSNGGSFTLQVVFSVGNVAASTNYVVFVLAVNSDTLETVAQTTVMSQGNLGYAFNNLPDGSYLIVAGTDENNDGFICDSGEPLCGVFPSLDLPTIIQIAGGSQFAGRDFPLQGSFTTASANGQGFRLLTTPQKPHANAGAVTQ